MVLLDVCLETVFTDLPYDERIARIAGIGYDCVEFWHPEGTWDGSAINPRFPKDAKTLRRACEQAGVTVGGFVLNAWDGLYGGCPTRAEDRKLFLDQVRKTIAFGNEIGCRSVILMPGLIDPGLTREQMRSNLEKALAEALELAAKNGFTFLLEPLNVKVDHAGFYLGSTAEAIEIIRKFDTPNLKLLFDMYHMQIMEGNIVATIRDNIDVIGHFHVAGVPGRAEPHTCELDYPYIFKQADELGYQGRFGLEYFPQLDSEESLALQLKMAG